MTSKELFYFTGKCLMLDEDPEFRQQILDMIAADEIEWQQFVAFCSNHLILPVIYLKFQSQDIIDFLPKELAEFLKEIYDLNRSRNEQILKQLEEITRVLNKCDIHPIFLKGAAHLLDDLYSDIGERIMGDIDFLVPQKYYLPSIELLENDGYSCIADSQNYFDSESLKHYPALFKPGFQAHIEIHRLLTENNLSWFNQKVVDPGKKVIEALTGCYVLSDRYQIIHNFTHSQLQHGGHINGIMSLRDLYDLYLLSKRSPVEETLSSIKCRQKAIAYYLFAEKAFGRHNSLTIKSNFSAWLLLKKHDLNHTSPAFYHLNRGIIYVVQRITSQTSQIIKSFYSKKVRRSVIKRLTSRMWYIGYFESYAQFFRRK